MIILLYFSYNNSRLLEMMFFMRDRRQIEKRQKYKSVKDGPQKNIFTPDGRDTRGDTSRFATKKK